MHSSYSHFSCFCYLDSFKLQPTIQSTRQPRIPTKNNFNYYFTIIIPFRKLPYLINLSVFKIPIFKLTGFNQTKGRIANSYDQPRLQGSTFQSKIGANCDTGGKDKIFTCLSSETPQGWTTFIQPTVPKTELPNVRMRKTRQSLFSNFSEESSPLLIFIRLII